MSKLARSVSITTLVKLVIFGAVLLGLTGIAQARNFSAGYTLLHSAVLHRIAGVASTPCSTGVPIQIITVNNQAYVRPKTLVKVENAIVDQSKQLRGAWGTPCVQFGSGGWIFTLTTGVQIVNTDGSMSYDISSHHYYNDDVVSATVQTAGTSYRTWARAFSHEVDEALVDPTLTTAWKFGKLEVCDSVENWTYPVDDVPVSDFVLPSYFNIGIGPWDAAGVLTGPFTAL